MYESTTSGIKVSVMPFFLEKHSDPTEHHFVWAYRVRIENHREKNIQLINRHWIITDANGVMQEVRGSGVVGEQPVLNPGDVYEYTSGTPLNTPSGFMRGNYEMIIDHDDVLKVNIPNFSLDSPHQGLAIH